MKFLQKKIFGKIKISKRTKNNFDEKLINNQQIINFLNLKKNDLEKEAILQCNQIKIILDFIKNKTKPLISRMTGSVQLVLHYMKTMII